MNTKLVRFTKYMLDAMFYIGIVLTAAIPVLFYFFGNLHRELPEILCVSMRDLYGFRRDGAVHHKGAAEDVSHCPDG